jgi:hypothetical protein
VGLLDQKIAIVTGAGHGIGGAHTLELATRITGTMPDAPPVVEPDDVPEDEWKPMNPANSSPLAAWLASDEAQLVTGQVIRSIHDRVIWMHGWHEAAEVGAGMKRWDAETLGKALASDVFRVATPGMRFF